MTNWREMGLEGEGPFTMPKNERPFRSAQIVLPSEDLHADLAFFTERLGFRVDVVFPADDPREVVVSGYGLRLLLQRGALGAPVSLRLTCSGSEAGTVWTAPNGTRVLFVSEAPPQETRAGVEFALRRMGDDPEWIVGRAGMRYRNLLPGGGRFGAAHIHVAQGGDVPDYVHFHEVLFQMIYCYKGWVRVAYEDQGPPISMREGDCVLQPPGIRHRVLECSAGLEVIEASSPAAHLTRADHECDLPTGEQRSDRLFDGQRFVHHIAAAAEWQPSSSRPGFEQRDTGIGEATGGCGAVSVLRPEASRDAGVATSTHTVDTDLYFAFLLRGHATLRRSDAEAARLESGDCYVAPRGEQLTLTDYSTDLELLEVSLPSGP